MQRLLKNNSVLFRKGIVVSAANIVGMLCSLAVIPLLIKLVGLIEYGKIALIIAVTLLINVITDFGFSYTVPLYTKNIPKADKRDLISFLVVFRLTLIVVCSLLVVDSTGLTSAGVYCALFSSPPMLYYWAYNRVEFISIFSSILRLLGLVVVVVGFDSIETKSDFLVFQSYAMAPNVILMGFVLKDLGFPKSIRKHANIIKKCLGDFFYRSVVSNWQSMAIVILGSFMSSASFASYSIADKIYKSVVSVIVPCVQVIYRHAIDRGGMPSIVFVIYIILALASMLASYLFFDHIYFYMTSSKEINIYKDTLVFIVFFMPVNAFLGLIFYQINRLMWLSAAVYAFFIISVWPLLVAIDLFYMVVPITEALYFFLTVLVWFFRRSFNKG